MAEWSPSGQPLPPVYNIPSEQCLPAGSPFYVAGFGHRLYGFRLLHTDLSAACLAYLEPRITMALTQCCCSVSLRTGAMTIAILYLVTNCLALLGWTAFVIEQAKVEGVGYRDFWYMCYILLALVAVCGPNIAVNSLLIHGLRRNVQKLVFPWIVWHGIFQFLLTLAWLGAGIWSLWMLVNAEPEDPNVSYHYMNSWEFVTAVLWPTGFVGLSVIWYWYACVFAYYKQFAPSNAYVMASL